MQSPSDHSEKRALRRAARERRANHAAALGETGRNRAGAAACGLQAQIAGLAGKRTISAYWPLAEEFDARAIMHFFHERDCPVALPVLAGPANALAFRRWTPETALVPADFSVMVPPAAAETLLPSLLFVPLLAFDRRGFRLGYGGGYYDRTIAALGKAGPAPLCVGLAFAM